MQTFSRKSLVFAVLGFLLLGVSYAQNNLTIEQRLAQLERAVANLEEYALLLRYNQIGSVADFDQRIVQLERSFTYIIGEIVQLQPAGSSTGAVTQNVVGSTPATPTVSSPQNTTPANYNTGYGTTGYTGYTSSVYSTSQPTTPSTPATTTTTAPTNPASAEDLVYLQVGAYNNPATAASARQRVEALGYSVYESSSGQTIRLFLGPFRAADVPAMRSWLAQQGIDSFPIR